MYMEKCSMGLVFARTFKLEESLTVHLKKHA